MTRAACHASSQRLDDRSAVDCLTDSGVETFGDETVLADGTTWSNVQITAWALEVTGTAGNDTLAGSLLLLMCCMAEMAMTRRGPMEMATPWTAERETMY